MWLGSECENHRETGIQKREIRQASAQSGEPSEQPREQRVPVAGELAEVDAVNDERERGKHSQLTQFFPCDCEDHVVVPPKN